MYCGAYSKPSPQTAPTEHIPLGAVHTPRVTASGPYNQLRPPLHTPYGYRRKFMKARFDRKEHINNEWMKPSAWGYNWATIFLWGYKYGDLDFQVGESKISDILYYCYSFCILYYLCITVYVLLIVKCVCNNAQLQLVINT
jgi:hypothetical protein